MYLHSVELFSHNDLYRNKITCTEEEIRVKTIKYNLVKENQTRIDLWDGEKIDSYPSTPMNGIKACLTRRL